MTRELKFRAWSISTNTMYFIPDPASKTDPRFSDLQENETWRVMQFTGLHDKAGKEIYEGDVLGGNRDFVEYIGGNVDALLVGFDNGCFMAGRYKDQPKTMNTYLWLIAKETEVIGNIYENPELLNA